MTYFLLYLLGSAFICGIIFADFEQGRTQTVFTDVSPFMTFFSNVVAVLVWPVVILVILAFSENETIVQLRVKIFYHIYLISFKIRDVYDRVLQRTIKIFKRGAK